MHAGKFNLKTAWNSNLKKIPFSTFEFHKNGIFNAIKNWISRDSITQIIPALIIFDFSKFKFKNLETWILKNWISKVWS